MTCPRCHTTDLQEVNRSGTKIDICPTCRGVWLDRGELDKLIADAVHDDRVEDEEDERARNGSRGRSRRSFWDLFD